MHGRKSMRKNEMPITDSDLAELDALYAGLNCSFGGIGGRIVDAYPFIRRRLAEVEAERDRLLEGRKESI
jgi:hypothetical protein